jgi:hypothetical protein
MQRKRSGAASVGVCATLPLVLPMYANSTHSNVTPHQAKK